MILGFSDAFFRLWSVLFDLEDLMYLELAPAEAHEAISGEQVTLVDIRDCLLLPRYFQCRRRIVLLGTGVRKGFPYRGWFRGLATERSADL